MEIVNGKNELPSPHEMDDYLAGKKKDVRLNQGPSVICVDLKGNKIELS